MNQLRFGSVCSGIEAASVAWESLGFDPAWFAEVDQFPNAVLRHHWPEVPNLGDITVGDFIDRCKSRGNIDVLVGGTPCQGFSTSGKRGGINDPRSALAMRYIEIAKTLKPEWVVWENVPGCLTSNGGRDFGAFVGQVAKCGYRWAYRVLDAQFFGVPQRRRRVFLVGCLGTGRPETILFEQKGQGRDSAESSKTETRVPHVPAIGVRGITGLGRNTFPCLRTNVYNNSDPNMEADSLIIQRSGDVTCIHSDAISRSSDAVTPSPDAEGKIRLRRPGLGVISDGTSYTINATSPHAVAYQCHGSNVGPMGTLRKGNGSLTGGVPFVANENLIVRRLMPVECERLMGFPDNHTLVTYLGKQAKDGHRYKSLGNSIAIPVLRWIGSRLLEEHANSRG